MSAIFTVDHVTHSLRKNESSKNKRVSNHSPTNIAATVALYQNVPSGAQPKSIYRILAIGHDHLVICQRVTTAPSEAISPSSTW